MKTESNKKMTDMILRRDNASDIAYTYNVGEKELCLLYLHGWTAKRKTPKGNALETVAGREGCPYLSLDYTGHGESGGEPMDFNIGQGIQDTLDVLEATVGDMPLLVIGNSIGGWIGLWLAEHLPQVRAFVGLAPAPDITQFIWDKLLPESAKDTLARGETVGPSSETQGFCFTKHLFEDAEAHFMLNRPIRFNGISHLLIGDKDNQVGFDRVLQIKEKLTSDHVAITLIKGADHHLSRPQDLSLIQKTVSEVIQEVSA